MKVTWENAPSCEVAVVGAETLVGGTAVTDLAIVLGGSSGGCLVVEGSADQLTAFADRVHEVVRREIVKARAVPGSNDESAVMARVQSATASAVAIDHPEARVIASWWHSGQASLGYSFVSTGEITDPEDLAAELWPPSTWSVMDEDQRVMAQALEYYLNAHGPRPALPFWSTIWV